MARSAEARDRQRQTDKSRYAIVAEQFALYLESQLTAASEATRGHMLSEAGQLVISDERQLWAGRESVARRNASEELRNFWDEAGRLTISQFERQWDAEQRAAREAALDAAEANGTAEIADYGWGE